MPAFDPTYMIASQPVSSTRELPCRGTYPVASALFCVHATAGVRSDGVAGIVPAEGITTNPVFAFTLPMDTFLRQHRLTRCECRRRGDSACSTLSTHHQLSPRQSMLLLVERCTVSSPRPCARQGSWAEVLLHAHWSMP